MSARFAGPRALLQACLTKLLHHRSAPWVGAAAVLLFTLLAFTYVQGNSVSGEDYFNDVATLRRIKELDGQLNLEVLRARADLTTRHDALDRTMAELKLLVDAIDADAHTEHYVAAVQLQRERSGLKRLVQDKTALVDRFKSSNLILHESVAMVTPAAHDLVARIGERADPLAGRAIEGLRDLKGAALLRSQGGTSDADTDIAASLDRLKSETRQMAPAVRERVQGFDNHIRAILREQDAVNGLSGNIIQISLTEQMEGLNQLLDREEHRADMGTLHLRSYLLLLSGVLTALLLYAAGHLLRSRREITRMNRELQEANGHLVERVLQLRETRGELVTAARLAGMAEIATNVLHNVGNILNSVNVSAGVMGNLLRTSRIEGLAQAVRMLAGHGSELGAFLTLDDQGRRLPRYLNGATEALLRERQGLTEELGSLSRSVEHIKAVVATQQSFACAAGVVEPTGVSELVEDALRMTGEALARKGVTVVRQFASVPVMRLDRARVLQILVNLISNARHAMESGSGELRRMTLRVEAVAGSCLHLSVKDEGEGIPPENLTRIFAHGFTTRKAGHGFGLHSSALAARQMGGSLTVHSEGAGHGATFTLELPMDVAEAAT